jgi:predicted nucleotidyltransferase
MSATPAVERLFGTYRRQVLGLLLLRPEASLHLREIGRLANVPAGSLHRELRGLAETGLLLREPSGNQVKYRANIEHPIYQQLAEIFRKTSGLADVVRNALAPVASQVEVAFVFGSVARGKEGPSSDVDVYIVGDVSFQEAVRALDKAQQALGREINPVVASKRELRSKLRSHDRFTSRIAREPKLFIVGSSDDFEKLAANRAA